MTMLLHGGGDGPGTAEAIERFVAEARARAGRDPHLVIVDVGTGDDPDVHGAEWATRLRSHGAGDVRLAIGRTDDADAVVQHVALDDLLGADGVLMAGGHTPSYLAALEPVAVDLRRLVSEGVPYFGTSAGAAIAAERAMIGGWRVGGVEVCPEWAGEDLDEVTVDAGLGLIDLAIDVHAAQWGTLARAIAAVESGLVEGLLAIDEDTTLVVGEGALEVVGPGNVWQVQRAEQGVVVSTGRGA